MTSLVAGYVLSDLLARYRRAYPAVSVSAIEDNGDYLEHLLIGGELDVAVMVISNLRDRIALQAEIFETSPYRLWLPLGHQAGDRRHHRARRYRRRAADHADAWTRPRKTPASCSPRSAPSRTSPSAPARSRRCAASWPRAPGIALLPDLVYRPWSLEGDRIESRDISGHAAGGAGGHGVAPRLVAAADGPRLHRHRTGAASRRGSGNSVSVFPIVPIARMNLRLLTARIPSHSRDCRGARARLPSRENDR